VRQPWGFVFILLAFTANQTSALPKSAKADKIGAKEFLAKESRVKAVTPKQTQIKGGW
jgi:hypothetical protein